MLRLLLLAAALLAQPTAAQTQQVLFPGETGATLISSIRSAYLPARVTGTNDDLYATVDRTEVGGVSGVVGVYTGLFVPFDGRPSTDPSTDIGNGFLQTGIGLNQEHTWPNSSLSGVAERDLHNLFPTQVGVNADRGTLPFAEIDDDRATRWYRGAPPYTQTTVPSENIDAFSEIRAGAFEPREDHKGNVARALFYMAAVYDPPANNDFSFDEAARETLYLWHYADPATLADQARSARVASFQDGKDNPFVLDSTLARRAFFPERAVTSEPDMIFAPYLSLEGATPFRDRVVVSLTLGAPGAVRVQLLDALGRRVAVLHDGQTTARRLRLAVEGRRLAPGVYTVRAEVGRRVLTQPVVRVR